MEFCCRPVSNVGTVRQRFVAVAVVMAQLPDRMEIDGLTAIRTNVIARANAALVMRRTPARDPWAKFGAALRCVGSLWRVSA